ncbi:MlaD family protein [Nocardia rhamnosiphila]|uniref:MlaD family protein n=1 Tax=Nocardia rhamnosiphila TaxID=426716 RepID=UPI003793EE67
MPVPISRRRVIRYGLPLLLLVAVVVLWAPRTGLLGPGRATTSVCAYFTSTFGLYPDAPVTVRGIEVGTVRALEPEPGRVRVAMDIDRAPPADIRAAIVNASLLTDRRVELVGDRRDGPRLPADRCIGAEHTATPVSVADSLRAFGTLIDDLTRPGADGGAPVQALLTGADRETAGLAPAVRQQLRSLGELLAAPDTFVAQLGRLIDNSAELSRFAAGEWANIKTGLITFGPGLELLEQTLVIVKVLVGKLAAALGPLDRLFNQHFPYLMEILESSIPVVTLARTRAAESGDLLRTVPGILTMLRSTIEAGSGAIRIGYRAPATEVPALDPAALCAIANRAAPGECAAVAAHAARLPLPVVLFAAVGGGS